MSEKYQSKYQQIFHKDANCVVMNDPHFHAPVTLNAGEVKGVPAFDNEDIDDEIKEDGDEALPLALSNIIFKESLFHQEQEFLDLKATIASYVSTTATATSDCIVANKMCEWYYIMKALDEAKFLNSDKTDNASFVRQMTAWFPDILTTSKDSEDKTVRSIAKAISDERRKWQKANKNIEPSIRDMGALAPHTDVSRNDSQRRIRTTIALFKALEKIKRG